MKQKMREMMDWVLRWVRVGCDYGPAHLAMREYFLEAGVLVATNPVMTGYKLKVSVGGTFFLWSAQLDFYFIRETPPRKGSLVNA